MYVYIYIHTHTHTRYISVEKIQVHLNPTRIMSTLHEEVSTFLTISR